MNASIRASFYLLLAAVLLPISAAHAQQMPRKNVVDVPAIRDGLCVSNVFQSNMVLQRDKPIVVWGWAQPGANVTVRFGGGEATAQAGNDRAWRVRLPALAANAQPQSLSIVSDEEQLSLDNVLVGDVWLLGGQSNMEFEVAKVENGALEIVSANYPRIRILTVPQGEGPELKRGFARLHEWSDWFKRHFRKGDWDECTPRVARELSAIGYAFARRVHTASEIPLGIIDASRGGTSVETWTPVPVLAAMNNRYVDEQLSSWQQRAADWDPQQDLAQRIERNRAWVKRQQQAGKPVPQDRLQDPSDLQPGPIANFNYPGHCYAGMLAPLAGLSIKGAIFHQGYNNALSGMPGIAMYRAVLPQMIAAWREIFDDPDLPFGIVSLCTDGYPQTLEDYVEKMFNAGIYLRAVQYETYLEMLESGDANIGFASCYDLRRRWYHPQVKLPAGERIARWALATQYGFARELRWQPPRLLSMKAAEGALLLQFDVPVYDPGDGAMRGFAIAGADRRFQPAEAVHVEIGKDDRGRPRLDRKQLRLTSLLVEKPEHFRYAWGRNPLANVQAMSNLDLPLATQRSDDWSMAEVPLGVLEEEVDGKLSRRQSSRIRRHLREEDVRRRLAEARRVLQELGPKERKTQPQKTQPQKTPKK
ncbi:MAG: hypothetical protein AB8H80_02505 [Planctomycetota bacterium]